VKAVNLIPNEQRGPGKSTASAAAAPSQGGDAFGAYAVLGALVMAVGAMALYTVTGNSINDKKSELAKVQAQASALTTQATSLQSFADFKTLTNTRLSTVTGIAGARFNWHQAMDDVSRALPSNVYLSALDGTTSAGGGGSSIRGAISAPAIELTGCTTDQASVARLMSSLRDVRGVTRVSLASSVKPDSAAVTSTAPAPSAGQAATNAVGKTIGPVAKTVSSRCPKGSVPSFDVVAFFERSVLSAAASPNSSAAGVSSTAVGPTGATGAPTGPTGSAGATTPASSTTTTTTP
jgi:Tfp pilus assembly protein PilN